MLLNGLLSLLQFSLSLLDVKMIHLQHGLVKLQFFASQWLTHCGWQYLMLYPLFYQGLFLYMHFVQSRIVISRMLLHHLITYKSVLTLFYLNLFIYWVSCRSSIQNLKKVVHDRVQVFSIHVKFECRQYGVRAFKIFNKSLEFVRFSFYKTLLSKNHFILRWFQ